MSNEITPLFQGSTSVVTGAKLASRLAESASNDPRGSAPGGSLYLNFSGKRGVYSIGSEQREIQPEELWAVNIASFEDGWVCWRNGRPASTRMANIYTDPPVQRPDPDELGPFDTRNGEGWHQAKAFVLRSLDFDEQGYFKLNSKSGVSVFAGLQREILERAKAGLPCWPIVSLDKETFTAQGQKNFKPLITVYGWVDDDNVQRLVEPEADIDTLIDVSHSVFQPEEAKEPAELDEPAPQPVGTRRTRRTL